jgi:hypothetical protein
LLRQPAESAADLARFSAGKSKAASIAMTAMTTSNSMRVNAGPPVNLPPGPKRLTGANFRQGPFIKFRV